MIEHLIETNGLTKQYGDLLALDDCTVHVERGEVFGLLGPNGSGKTTLLRLLMGFLRPTAGTAAIGGLDCYNDAVAVHSLVSYLPGEPRLFRRMRGRQILEFFAAVRPEGDLQRSLELAERLKLDLSRQVAKASTGMRQKLGLVTALSVAAPVLILDEPTSSLDPTARRDVLAFVRQARAEGRTVLFSSHVLSEVEEVCDRVAVLRAGKLVHTQVMSQLRRRHRIEARLNGRLTELPRALHDVDVRTTQEGAIQFDTPEDLAPLFSWLAELPLQEIKIEPIGLQAVYDRFHGDNAAAVNEAPPDELKGRRVERLESRKAQKSQGRKAGKSKSRKVAGSKSWKVEKAETSIYCSTVRLFDSSTLRLSDFMNRALWARWLADGRAMILACSLVLFCFQWLAVWITSLFELPQIPGFLKDFLPGWMQNVMPIPVQAMGTQLGILAMAYIDPVVLFTITVYAIGRGSDSVSGQLDRGTMEMLAAQPIGRFALFSSHACVTALGAAALAFSCWLGTYVGLTVVELPTVVRAVWFIPAALNLFAFTFFLAALTSLISSCQRYRRQTIAWVGGIFIVQLIMKIVSRASDRLSWLSYYTFFGALEPSALACATGDVASLSLRYDGTLLAMGVVAYAAAAAVFCRRDLPAPL